MFKAETIKKATRALKSKVAEYKDLVKRTGQRLRVAISTGNKKIGRVMNVSLPPVVTCGNCGKCKSLCYDLKAVLMRPAVLAARARNLAILELDPAEYFGQIEAAISRRRSNKYFRWHVGGEIPSFSYFENMVEIARRHPEFTFWTYTKMYSIVNMYCRKYGRDAIPANLKVMFSKWDGVQMYNPFNFPVFACRLKSGNVDTPEEWFENTYKCPGNCDLCKVAGRGCVAGESAYTDEH